MSPSQSSKIVIVVCVCMCTENSPVIFGYNSSLEVLVKCLTVNLFSCLDLHTISFEALMDILYSIL